MLELKPLFQTHCSVIYSTVLYPEIFFMALSLIYLTFVLYSYYLVINIIVS